MARYEDCVGNYGIVKITGGRYKGYYDDDFEDGKEKAVIYFGSIIYNSRCEYIDFKYIDLDYTFEDLKKKI